MLIYDHFETFADASSFAAAVLERDSDRDVAVSTMRLDQVTLFPFELAGVMVYVDRNYDADWTPDDELEQIAADAGGRFAGT